MNKQRHILLLGSTAFAERAAGLLESCEDIDTLHTTRVTIDLFLSTWRPDCVIINCDDLEQKPLREIEELNRFQSKMAIVLVSSGCVSRLAASAAAAILLPSEMELKLAPVVASIFTDNSHFSGQVEGGAAGGRPLPDRPSPLQPGLGSSEAVQGRGEEAEGVRPSDPDLLP